jgi:hypothetical protein
VSLIFPISSEYRLSFLDVANYWSREIRPRFAPAEVLNELAKAWWRGDLVAAGGASRVDVLTVLYRLYSDCIVFDMPDNASRPEIRELPDGSAKIVLCRVPLPNSNPDSWEDLACTKAFEAVAEFWDQDSFPLARPIVDGLEVTEKEFTRWIEAEKKPRPIFWARGDEEELLSSTKKLSPRTADKLAGDYFRSLKEEGERPTQLGFETKIRSEGFTGSREFVRAAYKRHAKLNGIPVTAGAPKKGTR